MAGPVGQAPAPLSRLRYEKWKTGGPRPMRGETAELGVCPNNTELSGLRYRSARFS